ncbi:predicted protein [Thalassiosira pseudonana CCMP1335]|uniref:RNA 3'-terminal phosphate cyclase-like protein n=1 Tax=Thalassiosira pseudonana TaxID=35128 RepID=B8CA80_THAPS|nr:predicted protein [Thalassiosira pseudonana CCMP1335]EED89635.1 predicted protein [Thalassiosira pseudonana CCMP1335]
MTNPPDSTTTKSRTLKYTDGATQFRLRLITSLLSHRPLLLRNIRSDDIDSPGLHEHEASFLRLLDRMTNGTKIEINATGTQLRFKPGVLLGGSVEHACPVGAGGSRGVGWFLEGIMPLAAFGKEPLELTLTGITDGTSDVDPSVDYLSSSFLPLCIKFGIGANDDYPPPSIRVSRRGAAPLGGGVVHFYCPIVKELNPIELVEFGKVKRVRGTAISCRIPPSSAARVAHSAKGVMHRLLPDVWIHTDVHSSSGKKDGSGGGCGQSPGLSVILSATTTEGVCLTAECSMNHNCDDESQNNQYNQPIERKKMELPEDLGKRSATLLLHEIFCGGCIDTSAQSFALLLMCLTPEDVSRIRLGPFSQYTVVALRLFKEAFGVEFKLRKLGGRKTVVCSCLGIGYKNMARAST